MSEQRRQILGSGRFLRLIADGGWEYVERRNVTGVVVVVALTADGRLLLTEQYRPPLGKHVLELPAGLAGDVPGAETEALAAAACRELLEETGYQAAQMVYLTHGPISAGLTSEVVTFFRALDVRPVGPGGGDHREEIRIHEVPLDSVPEWLQARQHAGLEVDPKIYAGLYFLKAS